MCTLEIHERYQFNESSHILRAFVEPVIANAGNVFLLLQVLGSAGQRRHLNVQEHVSYTFLNEAGIPTPK